MHITLFNRWVNDNNPDENLSYRKGWWDFVEYINRIGGKLDIENISTVNTFILNTPPPEEKLESPVVLMETADFKAYIKEDFGRCIDPLWTVSIILKSEKNIPSLDAFISLCEIDSEAKKGFKHEWLFPAYKGGLNSFSCMVNDKLDVYGLLCLIKHYS